MTEPTFPVARVLADLRTKWAGRPCQMCGQGNWNISDKLFEIRELQKGAFVLGGPIIPLIPIVCTYCGNTLLVNAIVAGVVPSTVPPPEVTP